MNFTSTTIASDIPYDELEEALTSEELLKNLKPRIKKLFEINHNPYQKDLVLDVENTHILN